MKYIRRDNNFAPMIEIEAEPIELPGFASHSFVIYETSNGWGIGELTSGTSVCVKAASREDCVHAAVKMLSEKGILVLREKIKEKVYLAEKYDNDLAIAKLKALGL